MLLQQIDGNVSLFMRLVYAQHYQHGSVIKAVPVQGRDVAWQARCKQELADCRCVALQHHYCMDIAIRKAASQQGRDCTGSTERLPEDSSDQCGCVVACFSKHTCAPSTEFTSTSSVASGGGHRY